MTAYVYSSGGFPTSPVTNDTLVINNAIYDWTGTIWQSRSTNATATRVDFIATAGQATKTGLTYTVGNIDCFLNGSKMTLGTDFTATDGVSVTFTPALTLNDEVQLIMDASASASSSGGSTGSTVSATAPSSPAQGDMWFDTTAIVLAMKVYNGTEWKLMNESPLTANGGTVTTYTSGGVDYKVHTFTSSSTFTLNASGSLDVLMVAGGGGGGLLNNVAAGGGAGGALIGTISASAQAYYINIGNGGAVGSNGGNTSGFGATAIGGGRGGAGDVSGSDTTGASGGSGGGTSHTSGAGGAGTQGSSSPWVGYGNNGGAGGSAGNGHPAGGGGGAGAVGVSPPANTDNGDGGIGIQNNYRTGSNIYYAGGGGGGTWTTMSRRSTGGSGGGGFGATNSGYGGSTAGGVNTGGGGGGSSSPSLLASAGGSGIVIIRYAV
jgi:hypothetical protein